MRTRIYVAGPISRGILADNIKQGTEAAVKLLKAGYAPLCPMLTCYMGGATPEVLPCDTVVEDWYDMDLPWVAASGAVLRLPGESTGADKEVALANELRIPVYHNLATLISEVPKEQRGDVRFRALLDQMWGLHCRKNADYGAEADNFANYNRAERMGLPGYMSALLRLGEKMNRLETFARKGFLLNEGVEDTLLDASTISLIALILFREHQEKTE